MATELRLCDEDQKKYAGEGFPEWVTFDKDALDDIPFDVQHPWEKEIKRSHPGMSIVLLIGSEFVTFSALGIKGVVWLAWKMAGLDTPDFADFNIKHLKVKTRSAAEPEDEGGEEGDDLDPPADGSTEPSSATTAS